MARVKSNQTPDDREVLEFDFGVRVYPPARDGGYWRIRWEERHKNRDTSARDRAKAIGKATEIVERLARSAPTELGRAKGADLVAHYLDPQRRPPKVRVWSIRHRNEQIRYCYDYVLPVIGEVACRQLCKDDFQEIIDRARTRSVAEHIKRCLSGLVASGLEAGHLLESRNLLLGVRWHPEIDEDPEPSDIAITWEEIPTVDAVHAVARRVAERTEVWWRELQVLLVAYSGMRWGEHAGLTVEQVDIGKRQLRIDRQIVEASGKLHPSLPKGRRRRTTMFPAETPQGVDLAGLVEKRLTELDPGQVLFPAAKGGLLRRSNYGRQMWDPACDDVDWPRQDDGRWLWTFHDLRHVFATWAMHDADVPIEDLSRLLGHSSTRVTQDIYIHVRGDMYDRFFQATQPRRTDDAEADREMEQ
jgi:site-specific recombinase XerC